MGQNGLGMAFSDLGVPLKKIDFHLIPVQLEAEKAEVIN